MYKLFPSLVCVLAGLLSAQGQTPPFTQAPPVGSDTSAGVLLLIDSFGSLRVFTDPKQGPYDDDDDTLVAVQNNSTKSISAIPLKGFQPIFDFDGDGLSTYTGTSYGPTGYEGPGVSFSNISTDSTSGYVNFNPPIKPGGSAYFSLEDAITTQAPPLTPPTRLLQGDPRWAAITMGKSTATIGALGCYLTSSAMMINYYAGKQGSSFRTDPAQLNVYLTANNGFDPNGAVRAGGETLIAQYARSKGVKVWYSGLVDHRDDFTLDQYLSNKQTPLLYVGNPHWALATGQATVSGTDSYYTLDPDSYPNGDTLYGGFNNQYAGMELYSDVVGPLQGLYIAAHSPVELVLTAPDGAQTGFNPLAATQLSSIPSSGYLALSLANDEDHSLPGTPPVKTLNIVDPLDGAYTLEVFGTGTGPYSIDFMGVDVNGNATTSTVTGNAVSGSYTRYLVNYSSSAGSTVAVAPLLPVVTLAATVPASSLKTGTIGKFTLTLSAPQTNAIVVNYKVTGSAENGTDYALLRGTKKIKPGKTAKTISILPLGNLGGFSKKVVKMSLLPGTGYDVGTTTGVRVKILADK